MTQQQITGRDLIAEGWQPGPVMGAALDVAEILFQDNALDRAEILDRLKRVKLSPLEYQADPLYGALAERLIKVKMPAPPP
jgi:hypothetical protein